jgi:integrase
MTVLRFTDRWIMSCRTTAGDRDDYADALCPGLHLRITKRGTKTFSSMVRLNGRLQRRTIGRYPSVSLANARAVTLTTLRQAAEFVDVRQPAPLPDAHLTYAEVVEAYVERHLRPNTRSWAAIRSSLYHPALRHLRTRPVAGIARREIGDVLDTFMASGRPQAAVNVLRRLKMMFTWAVERDMLTVSPCANIRPPAKPVERDRVLDDAEIAKVWKASFDLPAPYGQMYRMFLLTGQRRCEVSTMRWSEIADDLWIIPREKVKKDRAHAVPLTASAKNVLSSLPRYGLDGFVFSTTGGKSASSNFAKVKAELDQLSGVTGWTIHDLRRTVRSKFAELGVAREVARKVMNHEDGKVDRTYNRHEYLTEKREALARWETRLTGLVLGYR